ncbi:hypothetical protein BrevBR_06245 [Brevundimonas sp. BR2-1]|uniref:hypothetical protein n=1 Tax=Brevundimonas sp. BR2-1 TaxID=3031123 RepID=UPI0030B63144
MPETKSKLSKATAWLLVLVMAPVVILGFASPMPTGASDYAAWAQGLGTVLAIVAAIIIDMGAARRSERQIEAARQDLVTAHAERVGDWQRAFADALKIMGNARRLAEYPIDGIDGARLSRLLRNTAGMLDTYLAQPPPNPSLSFLLIAARTEFDMPRPALESFQESKSDTSAKRLRATLDRSLQILTDLDEEYRHGLI